MRQLAKPEVVKFSSAAAIVTALMCYPRFALWPTRQLPVWYLEATVLLGGFVLWAFVFAWHTPYTNRPVFTVKWPVAVFFTTTLIGIFAATVLHFCLDPQLRVAKPEDYPQDIRTFAAMTLFSLGFSELFLIFAPFAWLMRLSRNQWFAATFTVLLGVLVLLLRNRTAPLPPALFAAVIGARIFSGAVSLFVYLRGGILLVWWLALLVEARHLLTL